ncbi:hypothetical protein CGLAMM_08155 [Acetobacteraceae bacterium EV16G]|uniref:Uncharacterized protein n=1 Tax=Sorlinia euscelidii TaxID=3081148 RepID=A0ABU7U465_9PROT
MCVLASIMFDWTLHGVLALRQKTCFFHEALHHDKEQ